MAEKIENRRTPYFGDFVLFDEIGRGGMGVVYSAQQTKLDRPVALKVLHAGFTSGAAGLQRLRIEAEATAKLDHPNIVPIYELGEHEGHSYLAMQLVEGESLAEFIARNGVGVPEQEAARLLAKIAHAVHHAHQRGVLHRDLKPGNILLDEAGEPHLIDFGLAKCLEQDSGMTQTGAFLGTPAYASPEQAAGQNKAITIGTDVYSLGAILYALLTGQPPFTGESTTAVIEQVKHAPPRTPRTMRPGLARDLEIICLKCLAKERSRRYESALALAEDLERFLAGQPIAARAVGRIERGILWARRRPVHAALGVTGCFLFLGLLVGVWSWQNSHVREAENRNIIARLQLLDEVQQLRRPDRSPGWSKQAWTKAIQAAQISTIIQSAEVRDQATASLAGLDAQRVDAITNYGAGVGVWDRDGAQLLIGGVSEGNQVWRAEVNRFQTLSQTNSNWVTFTEAGAPCHLEYERAGCLFRLRNSTNDSILQQWGATDVAVRSLLSNRQPALVSLADHGASGVAGFIPTSGSDETAIVQLIDGELRLLGGGEQGIAALAISSDGEAIAAADGQNTIRAWIQHGRSKLPEFQTGRGRVMSLALRRVARTRAADGNTPQDRWLLAAGYDGGMTYISKLGESVPPVSCPGGHYYVAALAFSSDGATLASGGMGPVKLWDAATGKPLLEIAAFGAGQEITSLAFTPDGGRLAITCRGGTADGNPIPDHAQVWALDYGRGLLTLRGLSGQVSKVCFSPDGSRLAALAHDWEIGIWDISAQRLLRVIESPQGRTADNASLAFSPSGRYLAFSTFSRACLWEAESGSMVQRWALPEGIADTLGFPSEDELFLFRLESATGERLVPGVQKTCRVHQLLPVERTQELADAPERARAAAAVLGGRAFVVDGFRFATNRASAVVSCYEAGSGKRLWTKASLLTADGSGVVADARGNFVACLLANTATNATLIDASKGYELAAFGIPPLAFSVTEGIHVVGDHIGGPLGVFLRDGNGATPLVCLGVDLLTPTSAQFSPDEKLFAWGNTDGTVTVCELASIAAKLRELGAARE